MANRPSSSRPSSRPPAGRGGAQAGGRRRTPPPPVKKPFPWGVAAVSTVLGLLLAGILVYAVTNQGAGFINPLKAADKKVSGVLKYSEARDHVTTNVTYAQSPPAGGKHNPVWQNCAVYSTAIANEHAVHSLEHGAVWITYRPDLPATEVSALAAKVTGNPYRLLSPYPGLKSPLSLQAWGRQIFLDSASDTKVDAFLDAYTQGPQAPENGSCSGGTSVTGPFQPAPAASATIAPSPGASAAPSSAPSASPSK